MITPMDIENKEFKKSFRGYNEEEVDEFLDAVKEDYENLYRENLDLKEKLTLYQEQVSRYKSIEETLNNTLITAQSAAEDTCTAANKKAKSTIEEAEWKAKQILAICDDRVSDVQKEYDALVRKFKTFRTKFKSLLNDELSNIDEMFYDVDEYCKAPLRPEALVSDINTTVVEEAASALE